MHLQQTKAESRASGGPQYYFHDVPDHIKDYLRKKGACPVTLATPYGIAASPFIAVGRDHKIERDGRVVAGGVGHDRIQQGRAEESIGESVRRWYGPPRGADFERIDVHGQIHQAGHFILVPTLVHMRGKRNPISLDIPLDPLSIRYAADGRNRFVGGFWEKRLRAVAARETQELDWLREQVSRVVRVHVERAVPHLLEADLLRTSGALSKLGVHLGPLAGKWYDCNPTRFEIDGLPPYECPVEIKKRSRDFRYQMARYKPLPRAVVLCVKHDLKRVPEDIDILELDALRAELDAIRGER